MRGGKLIKSTLALFGFALILSSATVIALAQKGGTAAKGGSHSIERPPRQRRSNLKTLAARYRPIVSQLDLTFSELVDVFDAARKDNPGLKFETVITAYIAAESHSTQSQIEDGKKVVDALSAAHNNLALALQRVFSLSEEQAAEEARAAVARFKEAERQAARP
jgi:hypothetical protein